MPKADRCTGPAQRTSRKSNRAAGDCGHSVGAAPRPDRIVSVGSCRTSPTARMAATVSQRRVYARCRPCSSAITVDIFDADAPASGAEEGTAWPPVSVERS